jgi:catechol 2,3-dioxygenase-like lactoylglutathione lyase family enzyme
MDMKLEVVTIPVSDVERAKEFYLKLGWRLDETPPWVVQFTPPGSACSVHFGPGRTSAPPGSAENNYLVVSDVQAARDELMTRGVDISEVFHLGDDGPESGPAPGRATYSSLAILTDPDGNRWTLQEVTTRLPGRVEATETSFGSASDLAGALRRAATAHGEHEQREGGEYDENWPDWYAEYMASEYAGAALPS